MNTFSLLLLDATHAEKIEGVSSFVGEDLSGSFGILADHARMMTTLVMGLARYRIANEPWQYLAQPGAVLYFHNNQLTISTRHYLRDENYMRISDGLAQKILAEEEELLLVKQNLQNMEKEIFKQIWDLHREQK
ncbi:MAG: F0F1 ATP synthase subunit epsilon [Gammaproteobacteria bacterium]|nr:F0F1 ATP synthase subunit epsilon [Gammaproteobacteria bacterium]